MWLSLEEVLKLPYGTKLERHESDWIYRMQQELVIIDESRESGVNYPAIDLDLYNAKFRIID